MAGPETDPVADDGFESQLDQHGLRPNEYAYDANDDGTWGWTLGRIVSATLLVLVIGFWIWAFSPWAPRGHPDELSDPAFSQAAEPICGAAIDLIATSVEPARAAATPEDRAEQLYASTALLEDMLVDLEQIAPDPTTEDGDVVMRWIADWRIYVGDRYRHAEKLSNGIDERFEVTVSGQGQITDPIDAFANANGMPSCASAQDV